jgi:hypothetical protein
MRSRTVPAAILAGVVLAAAGCGGGSVPGSASGDGAAVAPADTAAFVAVDTDASSAQWQALDGLLASLPGSGELVKRIHALQGRLGPEVDVVVLPAASGGKPETVLLTQPPDASKLATALGSGVHTAQAGGWTAASESQDALAAVTGATSHLDGSSLYQDAMSRLAGAALAHVYANGAEARQLVAALHGSLPGAPAHQVAWASADVVAAGSGLTVHGYVSGDSAATQPYASQLLDRIPAGVLAVADFQASKQDAAGGPLASVLKQLGGETALYVTPSSPIPAVTLVTHAQDPQALLDALHGALVQANPLLGALSLSHATVGSDLVVSTSHDALAAFAGNGAKLSGDDAFRAAGVPTQTTGFVWVNLKDALSALAPFLGSSASAGAAAKLDALTAYGSGASGGVSSFTARLATG